MEAASAQPAERDRIGGVLAALGKQQGAGGAGRGRARCGGNDQGHGNLFKRSNFYAEALNQPLGPNLACSLNASRRNEKTFCAAWNVVTHGY